MIKRILPAVVLSLSLISCQMGLTNSNLAEGASAREAAESNVNTSNSSNGIEISYDASNVYLRIDEPVDNIEVFNLYINTDGDKTTGWTPNWLWNNGNGAEYMIQRERRVSGNETSFVFTLNTPKKAYDWQFVKNVSVEFEQKDNKVNLTIPVSVFNNENFNIDNLSFAYLSYKPGTWYEATHAPAKNTSFASYASKEVQLSDDRIKLAYDYKYMYVSVNAADDPSFDLFINSDEDRNNAYDLNWKISNNSADYRIGKAWINQPAILYKIENVWDGNKIKEVSYSYNDKDKLVVRIAFEDLNISSSDIDNLSFAYWPNTKKYIPAFDEEFISVKKEAPGVKNNYEELYGPRNFDFDCGETLGKGIIIPAYIWYGDITKWQRIEDAAKEAKKNNIDFYVVVNSAHHGPFTTKAKDTFDEYFTPKDQNPAPFNMDEEARKWDVVKTFYDNIKTAGGKIIGYVHTCKTPFFVGGKNYLEYRELADVKEDIDSWVFEYPEIDGIWLDEYYPRYEIAGGDDSTFTIPNDFIIKPEDGTYVEKTDEKKCSPVVVRNKKGEDMIYTQIDPYGGFYWQLCKYLTTKTNAYGKKLIKIGNAGGDIYSNQLACSKFVDVLVSFEKNHIVAKFGEEKGYSKDPDVQKYVLENLENEAVSWTGLNSPYSYKDYMKNDNRLALIHGVNMSALSEAISEAFNNGYSHVYVTSRVLDDNIWGGVPNSGDSVKYTEKDTEGKLKATIDYGNDNLKYLNKEIEAIYRYLKSN